MSDVELAVTKAKTLEALLEAIGATGKGLHEKVTSVQSRLPPPLVKKLRFVATVRNKIVHEANYQQIDDRRGFVAACDDAEAQLRAMLTPVRDRRTFRLLLLLGVPAVAAVAVVTKLLKLW